MGLRARHLRLPHLRRSIAGVGAAAAVVALTATMAPGPALADPPSRPVGAKVAPQGAAVDVMSRNLYLGADLFPVLDVIADPESTEWDIVVAATEVWSVTQASDPVERMGALADEIVAARPAVVGLQEVTTWTTYPLTPGGQPTVAYDFLELLLDALADRGVTYFEVEDATASNFTSPPIPVLVDGAPTMAVSLADRDVIIRRADVGTTNAQSGNFENVLRPEVGAPMRIERGWGSVDVTTRKTSFRFVNAHTEAGEVPESLEMFRVLQVRELLAAQAEIAEASGELPTVFVGDYNSTAPGGAAYQTLLSPSTAGGMDLADVWVETNDGDPGLTCCQQAELLNTDSVLRKRIDLVLTTPDIEPARSYLTGTTPVPEKLVGGTQWASDHAGVVARLVIPKPTS